MEVVGEVEPDETGTTIRFLPDLEIFDELEWSTQTLAAAAPRDGVPHEGPPHRARRRAHRRASAPSSTTRAASGTSSPTSTRRRTPVHPHVVYFETETDAGRGRGRDAVEQLVRRVGLLVREQHQHDTRAARTSPASRPALTRHAQQVRARQGPAEGEGGQPRGRGRARGARRGHLGEAARAAVRGPDEDEARQPVASAASSSRPSTRSSPSSSRRTRPTRARSSSKAIAAVARAPGRPQGARADAAQERARELVAARQARRLLDPRPRARPSSTSSRATPPAAPPSRRATAATRRSCRCAGRSSTPRRTASTRCSRTTRSRR